MKNTTLLQLLIISLIAQFFMLLVVPIETSSLIRDMTNYVSVDYPHNLADNFSFQAAFILFYSPFLF